MNSEGLGWGVAHPLKCLENIHCTSRWQPLNFLPSQMCPHSCEANVTRGLLSQGCLCDWNKCCLSFVCVIYSLWAQCILVYHVACRCMCLLNKLLAKRSWWKRPSASEVWVLMSTSESGWSTGDYGFCRSLLLFLVCLHVRQPHKEHTNIDICITLKRSDGTVCKLVKLAFEALRGKYQTTPNHVNHLIQYKVHNIIIVMKVNIKNR